jgi:hypothetical protein
MTLKTSDLENSKVSKLNTIYYKRGEEETEIGIIPLIVLLFLILLILFTNEILFEGI